MFTFFATIIIVYCAWFLVRPLVAAWLRRRFQRHMTHTFESFFRQAAGQAPGQQQRAPRPAPKARRKVFGRDEGEYVEFEDITIVEEHTAGATTRNGATDGARPYTPREPRVTDADWYDL